jgi:hypothetical protein
MKEETNHPETMKSGPSASPVSGKYKRTSVLLQSVAFPGLGLTRYKGGPHWIKGVAAYGCIAGSVLLNRSAVNTYSGINDLNDYDAKNELYQQAVQQDQVSEVLAYAAIAIWVSDLVWTFVGTSDLGRSASRQRKLRVQPVVDPQTHAPLLSFNYRF